MEVLTHARVLTSGGLRDGLSVCIDHGLIRHVIPDRDVPPEWPVTDLEGGILAPGFIDLQVNGGGDVLFNAAPTVESLERMVHAHRKFGTTGMLPTLITSDRQTLHRAIDAVREAIQSGIGGILGIHIEGPFLSSSRRGIHDARLFRHPDPDDLALLATAGVGAVLLTLAPEQVGTDLIRRLSAEGIIVAAGHSDATYEQTCAARAAGLSGFTHLFNAMSPLQTRAPGVVGAALEDPQSWCGIIADGFHVHPAVLRLARKLKPPGTLVLVTDAMPPVGGVHDRFELDGKEIRCSAGRCTGMDGTLAGSALDMASAVRNAVQWLDVSVEEALRMASQYPARILGLDDQVGHIEPGQRANLVCLDDALQVRRVWTA